MENQAYISQAEIDQMTDQEYALFLGEGDPEPQQTDEERLCLQIEAFLSAPWF